MPPAQFACISCEAAWGRRRLRVFHGGRGSGATGAWESTLALYRIGRCVTDGADPMTASMMANSRIACSSAIAEFRPILRQSRYARKSEVLNLGIGLQPGDGNLSAMAYVGSCTILCVREIKSGTSK